LTAKYQLSLTPPSSLFLARGQAYEALGEFERARADYDAALQGARSASESRPEWEALLHLGMLWAGRDYERSGEYYQHAFELARILDDPSITARSLNRLGNWHLNVEHPHEALAHHQEALKIFQRLEDQPGIAETLDLLGMTSYLSGDLVGGTSYYEQAVALFRQLDDRQGLTSSLATLTMRGITYQTDTMIPAVTHVITVTPDGELALKIARETDQRAAEAYALIFLAFCLGPQGDYARALEYAEQGLHIAAEIDHRQWMTAAHCALGALYRDVFALPLARQHLEQALQLANETFSLHWIHTATGHLASTYVVANALLEADSVLQASLPAITPAQTLGQRLIWCANAELALARKQPSKVLQIIEQLMTSTARPGESRDILRLARLRGEALTALNRASEAEELLQHASKAARQQGALPLLWRMQLALGKCYQTQRRYEAAKESFLAARDIIEQLAPKVPGEHLRSDFLDQTHHLLSLKPPSPKRAAKLVRDRLSERERIEQELHTAQLIQRCMLPEVLPRLSGWRLARYYQPAREVGGDFYDFIPFEDGRLGLLIGDATGKGIPAALVMSTTCTMLRTTVQATTSPGEVLARVNAQLYARIPSGMFVTCFYAILDPRNEMLRFANAGQDLPYLCHSYGVSELQATGMPLGLMPGSSYEEQEVTIAPGENILFYSDGIVEAHNPSREMFGFPRLQKLLAVHTDGASLIDFLLGELKRFTGDGWEQEDDVTLLLLQRMAEPAPV
jgi:tetratricopeptide (TPR) repeat protein